MVFQNNSWRHKDGSSRPSYGHSFVNVFAVIFLGFTVHRFLNFRFLSEAVAPESPAQAFFVGVLSDVWVGFLLTVVITPITYGARWFGKTSGILVQIFFLLVLTGALAAHQGYIEFFRFQIEPFHLSYLSDLQFIDSNAASFLTSANIILTCFIWVAALLMFVRREIFILPRLSSSEIRLPRQHTAGENWAIITALTVLALFAHNRNIHYRVQWFVPENLQTNVFESLYLRYKKLGNSEKLIDQHYLTAKQLYGSRLMGQTENRFESTVFSYAVIESPDIHPVATALKEAFNNHIQSGSKPTIVIVLLESLRPAETGLFAPDQKSLTPRLDELAQSGILFRKAFSTGSVTRGGQEAVFCGNFSGRNTSLMRNFDSLPYRCITDELNDQTAAKFWYHGGDGRFDGQEAFWQRHNIKDLLTMKSFPTETARTGWGVGDISFFKEAARKIYELKQHPSSFSLGMLLSVTNHIPWQLPGDETTPKDAAEPWFLTTRYTDKSVGTLVDELKKSDTWNSTFLVLLSDHGNKTKPYADLYKESKNVNQLLQSHINLIITGGITEEALRAEKVTSLAFDHFVSQADISTTLADVLALKPFRTMGKNLFDQSSRYPILSQTEEGIYIPALDKLVPYADLNNKLPDQVTADWLYRFHYKAALEYLLEMRAGR